MQKKVEVTGEDRYARLAAKAAAGITSVSRKFRPSSVHVKSSISIIRVISITPGGTHAWCESNVGTVRKPISAIPKGLMEDYGSAEGSGA